MTIFSSHTFKSPPPAQLLPVLAKIKEAYRIWAEFLKTIPKNHRYTLGQKIDNLFIELIEYTYGASQTETEERIPYLKIALRKVNTLNLLLLIAWEIKALSDSKYLTLGNPLNESAKMLGGWLGQTKKKLTSETKLSGHKFGEK